MHRNHRRKFRFQAKHHGRVRYWRACLIYSCADYRRHSWKQRRTRERDLIAQGRFDELPHAYRRTIYWDYR